MANPKEPFTPAEIAEAVQQARSAWASNLTPAYRNRAVGYWMPFLLAALDAAEADRDKAQHSARQFCGAHVGETFTECPVCTSIARFDENIAQEERIAELEAKLADARGLAAECLALNPMVSGDMEKVRVWADVVARLRRMAKESP